MEVMTRLHGRKRTVAIQRVNQSIEVINHPAALELKEKACVVADGSP